MNRLEIRNARFGYNGRTILDDISFSVNHGEFVGIIGPNGVGKTTLLRCIDGIVKLESGAILFNGRDIRTIKRKKFAQHVGYVPQSMSIRYSGPVFDLVLQGRKPYFDWKPRSRDLEIVESVLKKTGLLDFAFRAFHTLSGGEKQKVFITRALALEPDILLLDELTNHLDLAHQMDILYLIKDLVRSRNISVLVNMHDLGLAMRFADKLILLHEGRIFHEGAPEDVVTAENIHSVYRVDAFVARHADIPYVLPKRPTF